MNIKIAILQFIRYICVIIAIAFGTIAFCAAIVPYGFALTFQYFDEIVSGFLSKNKEKN